MTNTVIYVWHDGVPRNAVAIYVCEGAEPALEMFAKDHPGKTVLKVEDARDLNKWPPQSLIDNTTEQARQAS